MNQQFVKIRKSKFTPHMDNIPVIDFSLFTSHDTIARRTVIEQIYLACHEIGFMYLQNFDISQDLIEQVFRQSQYFFNLPLSVKQQLAWSDEFSNRRKLLVWKAVEGNRYRFILQLRQENTF